MITRSIHLTLFAAGVMLVGLASFMMYDITQAEQTEFGGHDGNGTANVAPYYSVGPVQGAIVSRNVLTAYGFEHTQAINRWQTARAHPRDFVIEWDGSYQAAQFLVNTSSPQDAGLAYILQSTESCASVAAQYPWVLASRAFETAHHFAAYGDWEYTLVCLNLSAYTACSACFDDAGVSRIRGITHEMGHALHLGHPCIIGTGNCPQEDQYQKGAMYSGWTQDISQQEVDYVNFAYTVGHDPQEVRSALNLPGYASGLHECIINAAPALAPDVNMSVYCYVNVPGIPVNPEVSSASGTGLPGGLPADVYGDVNDEPTVLTGRFDETTGMVNASGCFEDRDGAAALGHVYVEWGWDKITGIGTGDTWTNETQANCLAGTPTGGPDSSGALDLLGVTYEENEDFDGDGITTEAELGTGVLCGLRDPYNPYDYYDVNQDGVIDTINDILGVIDHSIGGTLPYDVDYDRPPTMAGAIGHWNRGAPDGVIDLINDILGVIDQYNPLGC